MMASTQEFEVTIHTSPYPTSGTFSRLWLSLIGSRGETPPIMVNEGERHLLSASVSVFVLHPRIQGVPPKVGTSVCCFPKLFRQCQENSPFLLLQLCLVRVQTNRPLGHVVLVRLRLEAQTGLPNLDWHCSRVEVRRPTQGPGFRPEDPEIQVFLCNRWLQAADGDVELRSGKCKTHS